MPTLLLLLFQLQIPAPVGHVNDFAHVIRPAEAAAISSTIDEVRQKSGGEIVVVTLSDIQGRASIDVARDIGRSWKVGAQGGAGDLRRNTGVVLLLVPGRRPGDGHSDLAIASGTGAEGFVTDALAGRVRDAVGRAAVEGGDFGVGLQAGVRLLAEAYAREFRFELTGAPSAQPEESAPGVRGIPWGFLVFVVVMLVLMITRRGGRGLLAAMIWSSVLGGRRGGGWGGGGFGGGGGGGGGGGFGGFGGGGGFSGGGASGRF
jgi:uncharacterized protein